MPSSRPPRFLFLIGMALYALTAWRSEGYHHPDEHFQILEFANYRLGRTPVDGLPWEFEAQIRPGLQPMLAFGAIRLCEAAGISSPFDQAFLLRLLSGWLCLWLFFLWAKYIASEHPNSGIWLRLAAVLSWFVPYLSVRFSSENWAGLSFGFGLLLLLTAEKGRNSVLQLVATGFLLALSFFFRFQMGFALAGLGAWWLWRLIPPRGGEPRPTNLSSDECVANRDKDYTERLRIHPTTNSSDEPSRKPDTRTMTPLWTSLAALLFGGALATVLGISADAWLYGEPVFTAFNYFYANIVQDAAAGWGTSPWWYYPVETLLTAVPPVSLVLLTLLGVGLWHERTSALVWCLVPFLLAHMAVGHKELRFLYPMLVPVLVLAVQGLGVWFTLGSIPAWVMRSVRIIWPVALGLNFLLLPLRNLLAAQDSAPYYRFLYDYAATQPGTVLVFSREKCLYESVGLPIYFYCSPQVENRVVGKFQSGTLLSEPAPTRLILSPKLTLPDTLPGLRTERIYTYFPDWILQFNLNDWQSRSKIWSVYRYERDSRESR